MGILTRNASSEYLLCCSPNAARLEASIPPSDKTTVLEGSIQDPQWLETQFAKHGIDTVFLNLTGTDELFTTMNFLSGIKRSPTVKHLVYLSACGDFLAPDFAKQVLRTCLAAHVLVKIITEQTLQATGARAEAGGFSWTLIGPTLFMENDRRAKGPMMASGFFPEPIGTTGVSRVACRDIALGVAKAVEDQGRVWDRKKIMIGTKQTYTANDVAKLWGEALGRTIRMQGSDADGLDGVEEHLAAGIGPAWGRDLRLMYEAFNSRSFHGKGFALSDDDFENQKKLLGREPSGYEDFVKAEAAEWTRKT